MTKQVVDLVHGQLIRVGDILFFTFKKHVFKGRVAEHGLVHRTTHNDVAIFPNQSFNSLTQWTESCIQDQLQEYHTRYSAWRRVRHEPTNKTMDQLYRQIQQERLREQHHLSDTKLHQLVKLQQQESCELKTRLEDAHTALQAWNDWYRQHYGTSPPPVTTLPVPPPRPPQNPPPRALVTPATVQSASYAWNPPTASIDVNKLKQLDTGTVAAYTHAFFT